MKIKEVLKADWTVERITVDVRDKKGLFICEYRIGEGVKAYNHAKFVGESPIGSIYKDAGRKIVVMERIIQFNHFPKKPKGKEACVGVEESQIPKEILELEIEYMMPSSLGRSDGMHEYHFDCYTDRWTGISGEFGQISMVL